MPGLDFHPSAPTFEAPTETRVSLNQTPTPDPYYNPRLEPKNYLDGPLSYNPSTRLRQMLARPGIVVCI